MEVNDKIEDAMNKLVALEERYNSIDSTIDGIKIEYYKLENKANHLNTQNISLLILLILSIASNVILIVLYLTK